MHTGTQTSTRTHTCVGQQASRPTSVIVAWFLHVCIHANSMAPNIKIRTPVCAAIAGNGAYVVSWGDGGCWTYSGNIPKRLHNKLNGRQAHLPGVTHVCLGPNENYFIRFADGSFDFSMQSHMSDIANNDHSNIKEIALGEYGTYVIASDLGSSWSGALPRGLTNVLQGTADFPVSFSLGPNGTYFLMLSSGRYYWSVDEPLSTILHEADFVEFVSLSHDSDEYIAVIDGRTFINTDNQDFEDSACDWISPSDVFYSNTSISAYFQDGASVYQLVDSLCRNSSRGFLLQIPKIRVLEVGGRLFSLDNRRLFAFKQAGVGHIPVLHECIRNESLRERLRSIDGRYVNVRAGQGSYYSDSGYDDDDYW